MASKLIITQVEKLQEKVENTLRGFEGSMGIYVSLNKTQKSIEESFHKKNINTDKIFFIDCVTNEKVRDDVLHTSPDDLDQLAYSINNFLDSIEGEKFLVIDALSTLLIYNTENKVAAFVDGLAKKTSGKNMQFVALSPETKGEELLKKIFNFFDEVDNV